MHTLRTLVLPHRAWRRCLPRTPVRSRRGCDSGAGDVAPPGSARPLPPGRAPSPGWTWPDDRRTARRRRCPCRAPSCSRRPRRHRRGGTAGHPRPPRARCARAARWPWPEWVSPPLRDTARRSAASPAPVAAPGRRRAAGARRAARRRRHRDGVGQVAGLPAAGADPRWPRIPAPASSTWRRPRPWPATSWPRSPRSPTPRCARPPTTATPPARSGTGCAGTRAGSSPTPTCSTAGSCPRTRSGRARCAGSPTSSSTSATPTAGCSARTSATCCAGCAGSAGGTAPSRSSCWRRRPSPSPAAAASRLVGAPVESR